MKSAKDEFKETSVEKAMLNLELICGGDLASKILPEDYRNLQILKQIQRIFQ